VRGDGGSVLFLDNYFLLGVVVLGARVRVVVGVVVVVTVGVERVSDVVGDLVGGVFDTLTEGVVLALVVVISHITLVLLGSVDGGTSSLFYSNLGRIGVALSV
jgi:hypothetical protein